MKKYSKLIFDLDDTLIDNKENVKYAFQNMMKELGKKYSQKEFERFYQLDNQFWEDRQRKKIVIPEKYSGSLEECKNWLRARRFEIYFGESITHEQAGKINERYIEYLKEHVVMIEYAKEVIEELSIKYEIIVATNGPIIPMEAKLEKIGIRQSVSVLFSAEEIGYMKPDEKFFEGIMNKAGDLEKENYLVIGDSLLCDIQGANQIGIDSIWFNPKQETLTQGYVPTKTIYSLRELLKTL